MKAVMTMRPYGNLILTLCMLAGCFPHPKAKTMYIKELAASFPEGSIISSAGRSPVSFEEMMADLTTVRIIYLGEAHTSAAHHGMQLEILTRLHQENPNILVGMEMFDRTYQPVLDQWSAGELDRQSFIEKLHWYANWRFDFDLYAPILDYIRQHHVPIVGLNIPGHVSSRIAVGGLASLPEADKKYLPETIDTSNAAHRAYVEKIFHHHQIRGYDKFDYFYMAQCVWEEAMAETVADRIGDKTMLVLAGTGHIINRFGIPDRAYDRTGLSFRTVLPVAAGGQIELKAADYIWISPAAEPVSHGHKNAAKKD